MTNTMGDLLSSFMQYVVLDRQSSGQHSTNKKYFQKHFISYVRGDA